MIRKADCNPAGSAFAGSSPVRPTFFVRRANNWKTGEVNVEISLKAPANTGPSRTVGDRSTGGFRLHLTPTTPFLATRYDKLINFAVL